MKFLIVMMSFLLFGCSISGSEENLPEAGSEEFSIIMDADNPVSEIEERLENAIKQQDVSDISWEDVRIQIPTVENTNHTDVLAFLFFNNEQTYITLEDTNEISLTLTTQDAVDSFGDSLDELINIFVRTADPSLDLEDAQRIVSTLHNIHLSEDEDYTYVNSENVSFEHGQNGFIPYADTHFTDEINEHTLFYSSLPLDELPLEE